MKKTLIAAIALLIAFVFTACPKPVLTNEDNLTQKKGWELYTATSIPAFTNTDGVTSEDLTKSYFYECELDDILYFYTNKSSILNYGKESCEEEVGKDVSLGNWQFIKNEEVLEFHLPYFFDGDHFALLEGKIVVLDENTLSLRIPLKFVDDPAKSGTFVVNKRGLKGIKDDAEYQFTLTYKIAK